MHAASQRLTRQSKSQGLRNAKRTKTFSGCTTCRKRHLKCDERRPVCQRCTKAKLECSGYPGYRAQVLWKPIAGVTNSHSTRASPTSAGARAQTPEASDTSIENDSTQTFAHNLLLQSLVSGEDLQRSPGPSELQLCVDTTLKTRTNHNASEPISLQTRNVRITAEGARDNHSREHEISHDILCSANSLVTLPKSPTNKRVRTHLDELNDLSLQVEIIHHWVTFLSDALMPTAEIHNVCKDIFVPIASEGAHTPSNDTSGAVALFYLIHAASAFHISTNCVDKSRASRLMDLALDHHSRGISHLQRNLAIDEPIQCEAILASLLLCIVYEPVTVATSFWRTHFFGAASWLRKQDINTLTRSETAEILYQSLCVTAIFLRSRLTFDEIGLDANFPFDIEALSVSSDYLIDTYGISKTTLRGINRSISLAARLRQHSCSESISCSNSSCTVYDESHLDRRELELYLALPHQSSGIASNTKSHIAYHYTRIFYYASLIYFKRILRSCPVDSVQPLIQKTLQHMEALEGCTTRSFAPFVWPVAVPFFEANQPRLQRQALDLLDFITERSKLSIWPKLKTVLCDFWAKRDAVAADKVDKFKWDAYLDEPEVPDIMMA